MEDVKSHNRLSFLKNIEEYSPFLDNVNNSPHPLATEANQTLVYPSNDLNKEIELCTEKYTNRQIINRVKQLRNYLIIRQANFVEKIDNSNHCLRKFDLYRAFRRFLG